MKWTRTKAAGALAAGTAAALALSACSVDPPIPSPTHAQVTITIGFWGESGIMEHATGPSLESQYEASHPWVDLQLISHGYTAHHETLEQALIAGSGTFSVAIIDEAHIAEFVARSDDFVNLIDLGALEHKDGYPTWKWEQAGNADGSVVIGLGADVGGTALCYRKDLFEAAGLPSDREYVSAALGDSWEDFIDVGQQYVAATGKMFIDNATNVLHPAVMQLDRGHGYYNRNDELDLENVKSAFDTALDVIESGISAGIGAWSPEWNAGLTNGDFAAFVCSGWMLDYVEEVVSADASFTGQWDIADIPGPGGNWGGSFFAIPSLFTDLNEEQEAYDFIEWLLQPEQQLKIMAETGRVPALTSILESDEVSSVTNEFFDDAPYGEIFAQAALDLPVGTYCAPNSDAIRAVIEGVLNDVQAGNLPLIDPWYSVIGAAEKADVEGGVPSCGRPPGPPGDPAP